MSVQHTFFAPAERVDHEVALTDSAFLQSQPHVLDLLNGYPGMAFILNLERQILLCNTHALEALEPLGCDHIIGLRVGEAFHCMHADTEPGGCGTGRKCATCGAVLAMLASVDGRLDTQECRLTVEGREGMESFEFRAWASPIEVNDRRFITFALQDISSEKRKAAFERIFFHDLLNTAGIIEGLAAVFPYSEEIEKPTIAGEIGTATRRLVREIRVQQELIQAERGELVPRPEMVTVGFFVTCLAELWSHHTAAVGRIVLADPPETDVVIQVDRTLLERVLGNLIKNALEASPVGSSIMLRCRREASSGAMVFSVHNPGVMPREVQLQVFERSFSTKGAGRGLGTYGVRLLTERYLRGRVWFESTPSTQTVFHVAVPAVS